MKLSIPWALIILPRQWLPSKLSCYFVLFKYPLRSLIHTHINGWRHTDTWFENLGGEGRCLQILKLCNWWWWAICSTLWPLSWQRLLGTHWAESWTHSCSGYEDDKYNYLLLPRFESNSCSHLFYWLSYTTSRTTESGSIAFSYNSILSLSIHTWQPSGVTFQRIWILNINHFKNLLLH